LTAKSKSALKLKKALPVRCFGLTLSFSVMMGLHAWGGED
jgi:hypothetical protein